MMRSSATAMRGFVFSSLALLIASGAFAQSPTPGDTPEKQIATIEARLGGRLGVAALETGSGRRIEHRSSERFLMCSTFKF
ncbi:MAG: class A beta-lactamase, partial [Chthoniobacterales bacterium]|nr:class A beta-lactamase [Chthoniobacterales bacterium]